MNKFLILLSALLTSAFAAERPRLQIFNGTAEPMDIFWLKSDSERVPNGSVEPEKDTVLTTTIGHRFAVVGRNSKAESVLTSEVPVQAFRTGGVPAFYTQRADAHGFPVVASSKVNPYAVKEAVYLIDLMLAKRADVRDALIRSGARMCILAHNEFTCDLPEFAGFAKEPMRGFPNLSGRDYWDARARGTGGSQTDPLCTSAEENLLGYPGDPYEQECILIHEFAHCIHLRGMVNVDPTFDKRLKDAYGAAMKAGLWKGKYASVNHCEYWAEGVQSWFDNNRVNDHDHNHVHLRSQLIEYDPGLAALCREVFGDTEVRYTKPAMRLNAHMEGYDPAKAPAFVWPDRLKEAKKAISAKVKERTDAAEKKDGARETREIAGWSVHVSKPLLTSEAKATEQMLGLLKAQLEQIVRIVPAEVVAELKKVPLYVSPEYPGVRPRAEYHPEAGWLREHGRDPVMAKAVEFTNVRNFEAAVKRMPVVVLHELAHAYHDRVIGFGNAEIIAAYEHAKSAKLYDSVARRHGDGRPDTTARAYAMTNHKEYFAEVSEAFFGENDFFPFNRTELEKHDPGVFALLETLWKTKAP